MKTVTNKYPKIILAYSKKGERLIISNTKGYLTYHWEYTPFTHYHLNCVWDIELLKSELLNNKCKIDWIIYQWLLNTFDDLNQDYRSASEIFSQHMKEVFNAAANGMRKLAEVFNAAANGGK